MTSFEPPRISGWGFRRPKLCELLCGIGDPRLGGGPGRLSSSHQAALRVIRTQRGNRYSRQASRSAIAPSRMTREEPNDRRVRFTPPLAQRCWQAPLSTDLAVTPSERQWPLSCAFVGRWSSGSSAPTADFGIAVLGSLHERGPGLFLKAATPRETTPMVPRLPETSDPRSSDGRTYKLGSLLAEQGVRYHRRSYTTADTIRRVP